MYLYRKTDLLLPALHDVIRLAGRKDAGHILQAEGIGAHLLELAGNRNVVFQIVHGAYGIADCCLHVSALVLGDLDSLPHVAHVVHGVEDPHYGNAVPDGRLHERLNYIVGIMLVAHQVLSTEKHLKRSVLERLFQGYKPLPRVLVQKPHGRVKSGSTPDFNRVEPHAVHLFRDRQHILSFHTCGQERLVPIPEGCVGNPDPPSYTCFGH